MNFRIATAGVFSLALLAAGHPADAQAPAGDWRTVAPGMTMKPVFRWSRNEVPASSR